MSTSGERAEVAKVMVSLPDDLLSQLDRRARERATTRSGLLRELAERELARVEIERGAVLSELLGEPEHYGGTAAGEIRRARTTR